MEFRRTVFVLYSCSLAQITLAVGADFSKSDFLGIHRGGSTIQGDEDRTGSNTPLFALNGKSVKEESLNEFYVQKRDGSTDLLDEKKVRKIQ